MVLVAAGLGASVRRVSGWTQVGSLTGGWGAAGGQLGQGPPPGRGPSDIALTAAGAVFVADTWNGRVVTWSTPAAPPRLSSFPLGTLPRYLAAVPDTVVASDGSTIYDWRDGTWQVVTQLPTAESLVGLGADQDGWWALVWQVGPDWVAGLSRWDGHRLVAVGRATWSGPQGNWTSSAGGQPGPVRANGTVSWGVPVGGPGPAPLLGGQPLEGLPPVAAWCPTGIAGLLYVATTGDRWGVGTAGAGGDGWWPLPGVPAGVTAVHLSCRQDRAVALLAGDRRWELVWLARASRWSVRRLGGGR